MNQTVSVKQWVVTLLIMCIPLVNIIMLIIWAFGQSDINESKKNWAKAGLLLMAIGVGLTILIGGIFAALDIANFIA